MTSNYFVKLNDPARCIIYCSIREFDRHPEDPYGISAVKEVVQYASGDYRKASLVGTLRWGRRVIIVFDYDNPKHLDTCRVLGFKFRPAIIPFCVPAESVHSRVNKWARENERLNLSFPRQSQITPSPKHSCHPPPSACETDSATTEKDLLTGKESTAKHPHSDTEEQQQTP